jgi:hypothetical protein
MYGVSIRSIESEDDVSESLEGGADPEYSQPAEGQ